METNCKWSKDGVCSGEEYHQFKVTTCSPHAVVRIEEDNSEVGITKYIITVGIPCNGDPDLMTECTHYII